MAGGLGFEPRLTESESVVLPLDDPPKKQKLKIQDTRGKIQGDVGYASALCNFKMSLCNIREDSLASAIMGRAIDSSNNPALQPI